MKEKLQKDFLMYAKMMENFDTFKYLVLNKNCLEEAVLLLEQSIAQMNGSEKEAQMNEKFKSFVMHEVLKSQTKTGLAVSEKAKPSVKTTKSRL